MSGDALVLEAMYHLMVVRPQQAPPSQHSLAQHLTQLAINLLLLHRDEAGQSVRNIVGVGETVDGEGEGGDLAGERRGVGGVGWGVRVGVARRAHVRRVGVRCCWVVVVVSRYNCVY